MSTEHAPRLVVVIPGPPVPWQRARPRKTGRGFVNPPKMRKYQRHVRGCVGAELLLSGQHRSWPRMALYDVHIRMFFPNLRTRDEDNVEKNIKDALCRVLWDDDHWQRFRRVVKEPALDRENPRVELEVRVVETMG